MIMMNEASACKSRVKGGRSILKYLHQQLQEPLQIHRCSIENVWENMIVATMEKLLKEVTHGMDIFVFCPGLF